MRRRTSGALTMTAVAAAIIANPVSGYAVNAPACVVGYQWTCVEFGITGSELRTWVDGNEVPGLHACS